MFLDSVVWIKPQYYQPINYCYCYKNFFLYFVHIENFHNIINIKLESQISLFTDTDVFFICGKTKGTNSIYFSYWVFIK